MGTGTYTYTLHIHVFLQCQASSALTPQLHHHHLLGVCLLSTVVMIPKYNYHNIQTKDHNNFTYIKTLYIPLTEPPLYVIQSHLSSQVSCQVLCSPSLSSRFCAPFHHLPGCNHVLYSYGHRHIHIHITHTRISPVSGFLRFDSTASSSSSLGRLFVINCSYDTKI